ncbi:MAG: site-specific DNA-methyltransferase [Acetobacteraceae bacterium]|nr:site-specific DNA-methyltransferase [Acetobacteraceae bacterium]
MDIVTFPDLLREFTYTGAPTLETLDDGIRYFVNEYWTSGQRQSHKLHEISYRACFKPELPEFFIDRLTATGDTVYDPFSGRGTTALQAALSRCRPVGNDVNPLSEMLVGPRLEPVSLHAVARRLASIPTTETVADNDELTVFFHPETLRRLYAIRTWLLERASREELDQEDRWIRMVSLNRLTGHSPGFFSVYTLPPNQAASIVSQRKINEKRNQVPPLRDVDAIILKKSRILLSDGSAPPHPRSLLMTGPADSTPDLATDSVDLVVTSPPFLDIVDYEGDNWLRCWFAGIDPRTVRIDRHRGVAAWEAFVRRVFLELARVVRPGGMVAFEVGEVRGGKTLLERHVVAAIEGLPFAVLGVMVNQQSFTKTANCWGVRNNSSGTNSNRIVLARRM